MAAPYFFSSGLGQEELIWLDDSAARHVVQVLRMQPGETIHLTDGRGVRATALIEEAGKKGCQVRVGERLLEPGPLRPVTVALALLKNASRFEWFLEKATELGISRIVPLLTRRTERQHFRAERMHSILVSALIQSQQTWLPVLESPVEFAAFALRPDRSARGIAYCSEGQKLPLKDFDRGGVAARTIAIGPEGDFTEEEIAIALGEGFTGIHLGDQRLRSETAAVAAAVLLALA